MQYLKKRCIRNAIILYFVTNITLDILIAMNKVYLIFLLFVFSLCGVAQKKSGSRDVVVQDSLRQELLEIEKARIMEADSIYSVVEQMPSFPGGDLEMMKYISKNLKYPEVGRESGIQGRVTVRFVVGSDGVVRDAELIRRRGSALDSVFLKLVQDMPKWEAGRQAGQAVPVYFTLPLQVRPKSY